MKNTIIAACLLYFVASLPLLFASPRLFFALTIPARAFANMLVGIDFLSFGGISLSFADLLGIIILISGLVYCILKSHMIFANRPIRRVMIFMLLFIFFTGLAAITGGSYRLMEAAKVISWLIYFPLGYVLFSDSDGIRLLKKSGVSAAFVTVAGLAIGNILKVGETAYGIGIIHLGFFTSEAALATALAGSLAFCFLPSTAEKTSRFVAVTNRAFIVVLLVMIVAVMVRSVILGIFFFFLAYSFMKHAGGFGRKTAALIGVAMLFTVIISGVILHNPQSVGVRFKDVQEYKAGGRVTQLGSGRISLIVRYFEDYRSQSALMQIFGIDLSADTGQAFIKTFKENTFGTHNDVLQILFLSGLVGLIFYVSMCLSVALALKMALGSSLDPYSRKIAALGAGLLVLYAVLIIHGVIFHVFLMQSIMVVIGASLGMSFPSSKARDVVYGIRKAV
jgi:hypothetical protein